MSLDKIIEIKGLTKRFKDITAVDNLNLNVFQGDIFGFLGPNGAGKSTTIRMILSLITPTSGTIHLFGKPLGSHRKEILSNIGAIVEKPDFYLYLTAYKNLELLGRISGVDISKRRIMEVLEIVQLHERANYKVKTFSYGMKQRLGIAQALIHNPDLIILDEPTNGLDPSGVKEVRDLILSLNRDHNKTIFLSSHILPEVEIVATRMAIINKGRTVVEGEVQTLLNSGKLMVKIGVDNYLDAVEAMKISHWNTSLEPSDGLQIWLSVHQKEISQINQYLVEKGVAIHSITSTRSLEDYFLTITQGNLQ
ncbi:MAG: ABC transporter ATP-binding protein [Ignavibacteria bacterium]|nr:ABC transporter ATP-binding protein [Ignavibacteria bacterium]